MGFHFRAREESCFPTTPGKIKKPHQTILTLELKASKKSLARFQLYIFYVQSNGELSSDLCQIRLVPVHGISEG